MSLKGIEMMSIHEDIIDGETYLKVLEEKILPLMNPYPQEKSVLFNDNAPVHNKAAIVTLCEEYGVIAFFSNLTVMTITLLSLYSIGPKTFVAVSGRLMIPSFLYLRTLNMRCIIVLLVMWLATYLFTVI